MGTATAAAARRRSRVIHAPAHRPSPSSWEVPESVVKEPRQAHQLGRLEDPGLDPAIDEALQEYIARRRQASILDLFGKIEFDPRYDYKKQRQRP